MNKSTYIGLTLLIAGFVIAGVGSFWGSSRDQYFIAYEGPYAYSVGYLGVAIFMAGVYFITK
jgi:hypothetical protein